MLVGFGESIKFKGSGFSDGVTANLYAQPGTGSDVCTNAGGGSWTNIGSTNVGSDHRFESDVEIPTNVFRSAGKYLVCAADGAGVHSGTALIIEIKVGLKVVGAGAGIEFQPGQEIALSIEGGASNLSIESVLVAGQTLGSGEWRRVGNNIYVTIPPGRAGPAPLPHPLPLPVGKPLPSISPLRPSICWCRASARPASAWARLPWCRPATCRATKCAT